MPIFQAFSTAVSGRYVIYLDKDETITQAMDTIQEQIPDISSIAYGSARYYLLSHRIIKPLVWIGHGDQEGINTAKEKLSWGKFAQEVEASPTVDIVLSCYSSELQKQGLLTHQEAITFNSEIDATFGGLIASWLLTRDDTVFQRIIEYSFSLWQGKTSYEPLLGDVFDPGLGGGSGVNIDLPPSYNDLESSNIYIVGKMSGIELAYHLLYLIVLAIQIISGIALSVYSFNFFKAAVVQLYTAGAFSFLVNLFAYIDGAIGFDAFLVNFVGTLFLAIKLIYAAYKTAATWEKVLFGAIAAASGIILVLQIILDIIGAGAGTLLRIAATAVMVAAYVVSFVADLTDADYTVG